MTPLFRSGLCAIGGVSAGGLADWRTGAGSARAERLAYRSDRQVFYDNAESGVAGFQSFQIRERDEMNEPCIPGHALKSTYPDDLAVTAIHSHVPLYVRSFAALLICDCAFETQRRTPADDFRSGLGKAALRKQSE